MSTATTLAAALWTAFQIQPYAVDPHPLDRAPEDGHETKVIDVVSAQGEIEAASFMLLPTRDMKRLDLKPTDLTGPDGAKIDAGTVDVRTVKVWWQDARRWTTYYNWDKYAKKDALRPEILLHDDALVKVDRLSTNNYLRVDYQDGTRYLDISDPKAKGIYNEDLEPARDAESFVPFDIPGGEYHQYWLTFRVPDDAAPGVYTGSLLLIEDGKDVGALGVSLRVRPFKLPLPRTHYDSSKFFHAYMMCHNSYEIHLKQAFDREAAERKTLSVLRNLHEHGFVAGSAPVKSDSPDDYGLRSLALMQQAGMPMRSVFVEGGSDSDWVLKLYYPDPGEPVPYPDTHPEKFAAAKKRFSDHIDEILPVYKKYLGHNDLFFFASDEGSTALNRRQFPFWEILKERDLGIKIFATGGVPQDTGWWIDANDVAASISPSIAESWHVCGSTAYTYAAMFLGAQCPDHYRRDKGLRFYFADFDGLNEYVWYEGDNRWNDFTENIDQYGTFGIVYPLQNGVVDTIAWEAMREGIDDIRYLSLLRLRAENAMKSTDPVLSSKGRENIVWLESRDPETIVDLDGFREEVAQRIATLPECTAEKMKEDDSPAIVFPEDTAGTEVVADDEAAKHAEKYVDQLRYRLAIKYLEQARKSKTLDRDTRIAALKREVSLLLVLRDRKRAMEIIDEALEERPYTKESRCVLLYEKARAILSLINYMEEMKEENVIAASDIIAEAQALPGASAEFRNSISSKLYQALFAAKMYDKVLELSLPPLMEKDVSSSTITGLRLLRAKTFLLLGKFEEAKKEYTQFNKVPFGDIGHGDAREMHRMIGEAAEARDDAACAAEAYVNLIRYCSNKDEGKIEYARVQSKLERWSRKMRSREKISDASAFDGDGIGIDLDE